MKVYLENFFEIFEHVFLKSFEQINNFIKKIQYISFSIIMIGSNIDENKVFEDLNSKGTPLLIEDLLRNYFFSKGKEIVIKENADLKNNEIEDQATEYIDKYEVSLEKLEEFLAKEKKSYRGLFATKINRFFKNYILYIVNNRSKFNEDNDRRMFNSFKEEYSKKITNSHDLAEHLDLIEKYFNFCIYMSNYNEDLINTHSKMRNEKYLLNSLDFYPFIFSFYSKWEEKYLDSIIMFSTIVYISLLVKQIDIWNFVKDNLTLIKREILNNKLKKHEILKNLLVKLLYPKQHMVKNNKEFDFWETFEKDLSDKISDKTDIYNSKEFKRFLVFYFASQNKKSISLKDQKYNIEHIISQNIDFECIGDEELKNLSRVNKIENLCLIEKSINEKFENENFYEKIEIYSNLINNQNIKSKIDEINKIFNKNNKYNLKKVLDDRKQTQVDFVSSFVSQLKNKWESLLK